MDNPNTGEIIAQLIAVFGTFVIIFVACECGQNVTLQFEKFSNTLSQCKWYFLPIELQRMLITVMINTQHPTYIQGYGNIECTRYSFKKVLLFH